MVNRLAQSRHGRAVCFGSLRGACSAIAFRQRGFAAPQGVLPRRRAGTQSNRRNRAVLGASAADVIGGAL
jgi:hypothetical protein